MSPILSPLSSPCPFVPSSPRLLLSPSPRLLVLLPPRPLVPLPPRSLVLVFVTSFTGRSLLFFANPRSVMPKKVSPCRVVFYLIAHVLLFYCDCSRT